MCFSFWSGMETSSEALEFSAEQILSFLTNSLWKISVLNSQINPAVFTWEPSVKSRALFLHCPLPLEMFFPPLAVHLLIAIGIAPLTNEMHSLILRVFNLHTYENNWGSREGQRQQIYPVIAGSSGQALSKLLPSWHTAAPPARCAPVPGSNIICLLLYKVTGEWCTFL